MRARVRPAFSFSGLVVAVCLVVAMMGSPAPAAAEPVDPDPSEKLMLAQLPLLDTTDAIDAHITENPELASSYSGLAMSPENGTVTLYWVGELQPSMSDLLEGLRADRGVQIDVVAAIYSDAELRAGAELVSGDPAVVAVDVDPAGAGLIVFIDDADAESRVASAAMVLEVRMGTAAEPAATRQNDASPWTGGARIDGCSDAFGMSLGGSYYMLTAAHCYPNGTGNGYAVHDGAGSTMGTTAQTNFTLDSTLIDVSSNAVSGYMYDGAWNNSSGAREKVKGTSKPVYGSFICTSGSYTGTNCDIKVTNDRHHYHLNSRPQTDIWGVAAVRQTNARAIGKGDSGGPVLTNTSVAREINAAGVISALYSTSVSCSGTASSQCSRGVIYVPIQNALRGGGIKTA